MIHNEIDIISAILKKPNTIEPKNIPIKERPAINVRLLASGIAWSNTEYKRYKND